VCVGGVFVWEWMERALPWGTKELLPRIALACFMGATWLGAGALFLYCVQEWRRLGAAGRARLSVIPYAVLAWGWVLLSAWLVLGR